MLTNEGVCIIFVMTIIAKKAIMAKLSELE
jgi:hypothetical protein